MYSIQDKWTNSSMDANIDEHLNDIQYMIYFICGISLLWPTIGNAHYENALPTTIPYVPLVEALMRKKKKMKLKKPSILMVFLVSPCISF
jgi:hypothetical protein